MFFSMLFPTMAYAEETAVSTSGISTALTSSLSSIASDCITAIGGVLPYVLPVMGAIVVITVGVKLFKRFAK